MTPKLTLDDLKRALRQVLAELRGEGPPSQDEADIEAINKLFAPKQD